MEGKLHLHIEYLDGRPDYNEEVGMLYPPGAEKQACMKLLADMGMAGGRLMFSENGISLEPISSMKLVSISAPAIVTGDALDLANLTMPRRGTNSTGPGA